MINNINIKIDFEKQVEWHRKREKKKQHQRSRGNELLVISWRNSVNAPVPSAKQMIDGCQWRGVKVAFSTCTIIMHHASLSSLYAPPTDNLLRVSRCKTSLKGQSILPLTNSGRPIANPISLHT